MTVRTIRTATLSLATLLALTFTAAAQTSAGSAAARSRAGSMHSESKAQETGEAHQSISDAASPASHTWTTDQIVTATVHQAWILSGKDEANFFEIVKQLAGISAENRNLVLPDNPAAGRRAGMYIKTHAKLDHDQLLYAIVDKAVRMTGKKAPTAATDPSAANAAQ